MQTTIQYATIGCLNDGTVGNGITVRKSDLDQVSALEPEVFLVDEALTVGDLRFSAKALDRIRLMLRRGTTLVFVSHNLEVVTQMC